jgi:hypothetical protein
MSPDFWNGLFEFVGSLILIINCYRVYKDKRVAGVSIYPVAFFNAWGIWNLYFYPAIDAWWSFVGSIFMVTANTTWVVMAIYYTARNKNCVNIQN